MLFFRKKKEKKLRIAQVAPIWIPVPPRTYGGIEYMLNILTEELVKRKYEITLFASGDSKTQAKLTPLVDQGVWLKKDIRNPHAPIFKLIKIISELRYDFDLIHNHFDFFIFPLSLLEEMPPILTTFHRPFTDLAIDVIKEYADKLHFVVLSNDQAQHAKQLGINNIEGVVPNGINPDLYPFNNGKNKENNYLLYLGRLNKEKGILDAIQIAKQTGEKLIIAGNLVGPEEWTYFLHEVQPKLNEININYVGQVDFERKIDLLKNAKAFLFPIHRREPFGLVMIEAMACGTPVIAYKEGSVPEVVEDGKTGFVVDGFYSMKDALKNIDQINRKDCRKRVEENFTHTIMVSRYEEIYKKIFG